MAGPSPMLGPMPPLGCFAPLPRELVLVVLLGRLNVVGLEVDFEKPGAHHKLLKSHGEGDEKQVTIPRVPQLSNGADLGDSKGNDGVCGHFQESVVDVEGKEASREVRRRDPAIVEQEEERNEPQHTLARSGAVTICIVGQDEPQLVGGCHVDEVQEEVCPVCLDVAGGADDPVAAHPWPAVGGGEDALDPGAQLSPVAAHTPAVHTPETRAPWVRQVWLDWLEGGRRAGPRCPPHPLRRRLHLC
mmetsp:Transcript_28010/g.81982  ORF Transcript_28010/g.81982 Transcript_28010/m.81982 type:complete len:245 (+) Transcript_28010:1582-2316(+)